MTDFELFPKGKHHQNQLTSNKFLIPGGYLSSNIVTDNQFDSSNIPELLSMTTRCYYNSFPSSNEPIYGTNTPFDIPKVEKVNFLTKSTPNSSHLTVKSITPSSHGKKNALRQQHKEIYLPPNFPTYCQYLRGEVKI